VNTDVISWVYLTAGMATIAACAVWVLWRHGGGLHGNRHCRCGHPRISHLHYRAGRECSYHDCDCPRYKPINWDQWIRELTNG
jgi:hypothetical protein